MNEQQKQEEIGKIVSVCKKYNIEYDVKKLDFIEKDTIQLVDFNSYALVVIEENRKLIIDDFYSLDQLDNYLEIIQVDNSVHLYHQVSKKLVGYILIDKEEKIKDFIDFYETFINPNTGNQIPTHSPTHIKRIGQKYRIFDYLKIHEYLTDVNINGKLIMCLDTKDNKINTVINYMVKHTKCSPRVCLTRYLNLFGFQWKLGRTQCCIPVDIKTFEEYYLPFNKIMQNTNYENSLINLNILYNFYNISLPNSEEDSLKAILENQSLPINFLLEKHAAYPRATR